MRVTYHPTLMFSIPPNGTRIITLDDETIDITRLSFNTFQFRIYNRGNYSGSVLFKDNMWSLAPGQMLSKNVREYLETNTKVSLRLL